MRILVTGAWQGYQECADLLKSMKHEIAYLQWEKDPLPVEPEWVEAIIGNGIFLYHAIETFPNLRYIQITSAGYDRVPLEYVQKHGIDIHNARGVYSIPMAEYVIGGVLQLYKEYPLFHSNQRERRWEKIRFIKELSGKRVCIIGCGSIGTECAKRFKAFGCHVIGINRTIRIEDAYDQMFSAKELDRYITDADIVVLSIPLNKETRGLMNYERMLSLKKDAVIVNIARGSVMDYEGFIELKTSGKRNDLMGVFDVFEEEPLSENSKLWELDKVIVTPHNSFVGEENRKRLKQVICNNLMNYNDKNERY